MWTNSDLLAVLFLGVALGAALCAFLAAEAGAFDQPSSATTVHIRRPGPLPPIKGPDERRDWRLALRKRAAAAGGLLWAGAVNDAGRAKKRLAAVCGASARALAKLAAGLGED